MNNDNNISNNLINKEYPSLSLIKSNNAYKSNSADILERNFLLIDNKNTQNTIKNLFKSQKVLNDLDKENNNYLKPIESMQRSYKMGHKICSMFSLNNYRIKDYIKQAHNYDNNISKGKYLKINEYNSEKNKNLQKSESMPILKEKKTNILNNEIKYEDLIIENKLKDNKTEYSTLKFQPLNKNKLVIDKDYSGHVVKHPKGFWNFENEYIIYII